MGFRSFRGKKDITANKSDRLENRYPVETDVLLTCGTYKGHFKTKDLSSGGFALKQNVPKDLEGKEIDFTLQYTTSAGEKLETSGKVQMIKGSLNRFQVIFGEIENFFAKISPQG